MSRCVYIVLCIDVMHYGSRQLDQIEIDREDLMLCVILTTSTFVLFFALQLNFTLRLFLGSMALTANR